MKWTIRHYLTVQTIMNIETLTGRDPASELKPFWVTFGVSQTPELDDLWKAGYVQKRQPTMMGAPTEYALTPEGRAAIETVQFAAATQRLKGLKKG